MLIEELPKLTKEHVMSLSAYSIQGKRVHMEDYFDIGYQMKPCDQRRPNEWPYEYFYFGIFDGHGGREAANFAKDNLLKHITKQKDFWSDDDEDIKRAIGAGFAETHSAMRKIMPTWSRTSRVLPSTAGTTASVLFIKNGKFYTGHVGDSRIVISRENNDTKHWISQQLTEDHKPESKIETDRIKRAGGEVKSKIGVHRVVWRRPVLNHEMEAKLMFGPKTGDYDDYLRLVSAYPIKESLVHTYQAIPFLAIARSLGDFWSINPYSGQYIVSPEPDVSCRPIEPNDKCILLATDGLWNVMNSSQAIRILQELNISKNGRRQYYESEYFTIDNFYDVAGEYGENHAQSLVYLAYQMWERRSLRSDNITVVVAMLHDILAHFQTQPNEVHLTRASTLPVKDVNQNYRTKLVQLGETKSYLERIRLDKEPMFRLPDANQYDDLRYKLEDLLIFPPTVFEQELDLMYLELGYPKNYSRLSRAALKKIARCDDNEDSYIYIKRVSDDPADERKLPTRINAKGKEVRDASAQATQCIHDFGQPWDQLVDDSAYDPEGPGGELVFLHELEDAEKDDDEDDDEDDERVEKAEDEINDLLQERLEIECSVKDLQKNTKSIPQLRCLLNYTPPLRRSTRCSHQSLSDNSKRKSHLTTTAALPKSKRRKSQPIRLNLSRI